MPYLRISNLHQLFGQDLYGGLVVPFRSELDVILYLKTQKRGVHQLQTGTGIAGPGMDEGFHGLVFSPHRRSKAPLEPRCSAAGGDQGCHTKSFSSSRLSDEISFSMSRPLSRKLCMHIARSQRLKSL